MFLFCLVFAMSLCASVYILKQISYVRLTFMSVSSKYMNAFHLHFHLTNFDHYGSTEGTCGKKYSSRANDIRSRAHDIIISFPRHNISCPRHNYLVPTT